MKLSKTLPVLAIALALSAPIALLARADDDAKLPGGAQRRRRPRPPSWSTACCPTAATPTGRARSTTRCRRTSSSATSRRWIRGKLFFTAQDIAKFAPLPDAARRRDQERPTWSRPYDDLRHLQAARRRSASRYARSLLKQDKFDFSGNDRYDYDREDAPWAADTAELDELWTQVGEERLAAPEARRQDSRTRSARRSTSATPTWSTRVDELNGEDVFQTFLNAYATSIDPHTDYFNPRSARELQPCTMSLSLEGIGAVLQRRTTCVVIREIVPGGPAARSGKLKAGDRIVAVGQGDVAAR